MKRKTKQMLVILLAAAMAVTAVTVTAKAGKSTGAVTVFYEGTDDTTYDIAPVVLTKSPKRS